MILLLILITVNYVLNLEIDFGFSYGHKYYITFYPTLKTNQFQGMQTSLSVKNQMSVDTFLFLSYSTRFIVSQQTTSIGVLQT